MSPLGDLRAYLSNKLDSCISTVLLLQLIKLKFDFVDVKDPVTNTFDHVYIYDGQGVDNNSMNAHITGRSTSACFLSSQSSVLVRFIADRNVVSVGFQLTYTPLAVGMCLYC